MSEVNGVREQVCCRDCGQPLAVIRQDGWNGHYLIQVTCWQRTCLLHGFTLSLNHYKSMTEPELENYRRMNRIYPPEYVRSNY